jgi:hydrogenase maturation protein HypF
MIELEAAPSARRWVIGGRVQGVGFRPFVCTLAGEMGVNGWVRNWGGLVEIVAGCDRARADQFLRRLLSEPPDIACPEFVSAEPCLYPASGFRIVPSTEGPGAALLPDQSACEACLREAADPLSRRYRYPFVTCTQCGPRYTITRAMPFDRGRTVMADFPLCAACQAEYGRPADRRFHAQVMACPDCGPRLTYMAGKESVTGNAACMARAIDALREGAILAVKGVGGYHLLCDASCDPAIRRLRARKRRPAKPLAVLFPWRGPDGLACVRRHCAPNEEEARCLTAPARPIVLVRLLAVHGLSAAVAPALAELGALLPYSPLHHMIAGTFGGPLVATSGNVSGEPVLTDSDEAELRLAAIADAFLHHDRPILRPADDGVVRVIAGRARSLRLGRGCAPLELAVPQHVAAPVLALGGHMKVTAALAFGGRVVVSPHIGDLDSPRGLGLLEATAETLQHLLGVRARALICDAHPGYTGTRWAKARGDLPVLCIPHHRAHASAVAGEFLEETRWLCFTWDGAGLGEDGTIWGGEGLLGQPGAWARVASFRPFAPPGADKAAREPWRSAAALAWAAGIAWTPPGRDTALARSAWQKKINCPQTSSVGRLFDAAGAFLDLVHHASYEGEAAMAVEALAETGAAIDVALPLQRRGDGVWEADWAPLVAMLLDKRLPASQLAAAFHASLARNLVDQAMAVRNLHGDFAVGLAGGVFQNRLLSEAALQALTRAGFRAYLPAIIPCNDGGLSFGQVIEAAARQRGEA